MVQIYNTEIQKHNLMCYNNISFYEQPIIISY